MFVNKMFDQLKGAIKEFFKYAYERKYNLAMVSSYGSSVTYNGFPLRVINEEIDEMIINLDKDGFVTFISDYTLKIYGMEAKDILGKHIISINEQIGFLDNNWFYEVVNDYYSKNVIEINNKWFLWKYEVKLNEANQVDVIVGVGKEISKENRFKNYLLYDKYYDSLTGLLNKRGLHEKVSSIRNVKRAVSFFIDIWGFTKLNNYYGNKFGEEIVSIVAKELVDFSDENCIVSRYSDDRFVVLCLNEKACSEVIGNQLARLNEIMVTNYKNNQMNINIDKRIGYAIFPDDTNKFENLISLSNLAMNESFKNGKIKIVRYEKHMSDVLEKNVIISTKLEKAINEEIIEVHFQKVVDANTNEVVSLEQLARWTDPDLGYISPPEFINVAVQANLLDKLERYLIDKSLKAFTKISECYPKANLSINLTPCSLLDISFIEYLNQKTKEYGIEKTNICIEVSESTFVNSIDLCISRINEYKNNNYLIAIDDFGKEYSALSILDKVMFDIIKIDASFIEQIPHTKNIEIIKMIRRIANLSNKEIIAEGVENSQQRDALKGIGCFLQQGYFFHRPEFMA